MPRILLRAHTIDASVVDLIVEIEKKDHLVETCEVGKRRPEGDMKGFLSLPPKHWFPPS